MVPFQCLRGSVFRYILRMFLPNYTFFMQLSSPQYFMAPKSRDRAFFHQTGPELRESIHLCCNS
uniref:Uncharacterized protein n=1 Tax=Picea glauca TaxID=3330 RepID=A0A101LTX3_PICGL|nr:hypothetical protein ABT39_MTgene3509 [Picea glauca]